MEDRRYHGAHLWMPICHDSLHNVWFMCQVLTNLVSEPLSKEFFFKYMTYIYIYLFINYRYICVPLYQYIVSIIHIQPLEVLKGWNKR